jgi:hypothetical protein
MIFRKLKRVWSHNDMNHIPKFRETFPELNKISSEEMCNRWSSIGIDYYTQEQTEISGLIRITLPFALILVILMFLSLPINFMITGSWGFKLRKNPRIYNWFKALSLI